MTPHGGAPPLFRCYPHFRYILSRQESLSHLRRCLRIFLSQHPFPLFSKALPPLSFELLRRASLKPTPTGFVSTVFIKFSLLRLPPINCDLFASIALDWSWPAIPAALAPPFHDRCVIPCISLFFSAQLLRVGRFHPFVVLQEGTLPGFFFFFFASVFPPYTFKRVKPAQIAKQGMCSCH